MTEIETVTTPTIEVRGQTFHVADRVGLMPMMKFGLLAKQGVDADSMDGLVAMYELLQNVIHPADWVRLEQHVTDERLDGDELLEEVVGEAMSALTNRPTGQPSDSSAGLPTTVQSSTGDSSSPAIPSRVVQRLNDKGRPDLALLVRKREESLAG